MSPHYQRPLDSSMAPAEVGPPPSKQNMLDQDVIEDAAESLREADLEAVQSTSAQKADRPDRTANLEDWNIDELRSLAAELDIPDRAQIVETDDLIAAIRMRL